MMEALAVVQMFFFTKNGCKTTTPYDRIILTDSCQILDKILHNICSRDVRPPQNKQMY